MLVISQSRNGGAVAVPAGEPFRIELFESPTTGYRWELASPTQVGLRVTEDSFDTSQNRPGAGGVHHWTFVADHPAVVSLRFERKRSWQARPVETFTVDVTVG
jgi:predicted secreted protein